MSTQIPDAPEGYRYELVKIGSEAVLPEAAPPEPVAYRWKWDKHLEWHYGEYLSQRDYYASEPLYTRYPMNKDEAKEDR
jgi:hypothetical protein